MKVSPLYLKTLPHTLARRIRLTTPLFAHQAALFDQWDQGSAFVLITPTGSGKTQAALLPCVENGETAIFLYPTNALMEDQYRSFGRFFKRFEQPFVELNDSTSETDIPTYQRAAAIVCRVDAESLEAFRRRWMYRAKGRALDYVLSHQDRPLLLLTNPDTLFLIVAGRYAQSESSLGRLQGITLVVDEFHLYSGVELARLVFLVFFLLKSERQFLRRVVFLSATPDAEALRLLQDLFAPQVITHTPDPAHEGTTVQYPIDLEVKQQSGKTTDQMAEHIDGLRAELLEERAGLNSDPESQAVPLVAITNSVFGSIALEDSLRRGPGHWLESELGIYRGLSNRAIRQTDGKVVVLGTSAIEVGVDFDTKQLVFEANSAESFLQRLGRLGRHNPGSATLFAPAHVVREASKLDDTEISRDELATKAGHWYGQSATHAWFARTTRGLLVAKATLARLETLARELGATRLEQELQRVMAVYAGQLGYTQRLPFIVPWLKGFAGIQTFRGGAQIEVFDHIEASRRSDKGGGHYEADLDTVLGYGREVKERIGRNGKEYAEILGYGKRREVVAGTILDEMQCICRVQDAGPQLLADGQPTAFANYFDKPGHVCVQLPWSFGLRLKQLDWRLQYYRTTRGVMLFDDDALLALELFERVGAR